MAKVNSITSSDWNEVFSFGFVRSMFRGAGQVMFQNCAWTGLLFLLGIFWGAYSEGSPYVAWGALVGVFVSTLSGYLLGLPSKDGRDGLWGFNGILVGCAFPTFLGNTVWMWLGLILCSALTTWVRAGFNNVMAPWKVNSFTFPFVFSTWLFLLAARVMKGMPPDYMATPELPGNFSTVIDLHFGHLVIYWLKGIAQVFLINSWVTGIFFLLGLLVSTPWAALWAAFASAVSLLVILVFRGPGADIANGLYGFSPVLTGIALGATFYSVNWRSALWALTGIIVTVFVQAAMNILLTPYGVAALTSPFCITTWLFLLPLFKFNVKSEEAVDHSLWRDKNIRHMRAEAAAAAAAAAAADAAAKKADAAAAAAEEAVAEDSKVKPAK